MKVLVIANERSGGISLTRMISKMLNSTWIDDIIVHLQHAKYSTYPNWILEWYEENSINFNDHLKYFSKVTDAYERICVNYTKLLDYIYNKIPLVKITTDNTFLELHEIIDYCQKNNIKIIYLYRKDEFSRALSKCVADNTGNYGIKDQKIDITIDVSQFIYETILNKKLHKNIMKILQTIDKNNYKIITYEELYDNKQIDQIYDFLNTEKNNEEVNKILYKTNYNSDYITIINRTELEEQYKNISDEFGYVE